MSKFIGDWFAGPKAATPEPPKPPSSLWGESIQRAGDRYVVSYKCPKCGSSFEINVGLESTETELFCWIDGSRTVVPIPL